MLHIILVILKIAGILLAAVLLLLMLVFLLLLFVPLRYEVKARRIGQETWVRGKVSWLCHLLTVRGSYEYPKGLKADVRVLWFHIFQKPAPKDNRAVPRRTKQPKNKKVDRPGTSLKSSKGSHTPVEKESLSRNESIQEEKTLPNGDENSIQKESIPPNWDVTSLQEKATAEAASAITEKKEIPMAESGPSAQEDFEYSDYFLDEHSSKRNASNQETTKIEMTDLPKKQHILDRIRAFLQRIPAFFQRIRSLLQSMVQAVRGGWNRFQNLARTISEFKARIQHYLEIWNEEETKALRKALFGYVKYILHHIRPRKVKGCLKYGFSDPSVTGQLTGILYLLRPVAFSGLELMPVFDTEEFIAEGELYLKGHIRAVHVVYIGLKLLFDKNLKHLRKRLKE